MSAFSAAKCLAYLLHTYENAMDYEMIYCRKIAD